MKKFCLCKLDEWTRLRDELSAAGVALDYRMYVVPRTPWVMLLLGEKLWRTVRGQAGFLKLPGPWCDPQKLPAELKATLAPELLAARTVGDLFATLLGKDVFQ